LAALLNTCLDGGRPLPSGVTPESIADTLENGTTAQIKALNSKLDLYNNAGDLIKLAPTETCVQGSANPSAGKSIADKDFADCD
jgi:hypothetical protein